MAGVGQEGGARRKCSARGLACMLAARRRAFVPVSRHVRCSCAPAHAPCGLPVRWCGAEDGLEWGRQCFDRWGFHRVEDVVSCGVLVCAACPAQIPLLCAHVLARV